MPFVQGKCESCGGILTVDPSLKAANCPFCGVAYVVQDSINNYNTTIKVENLHADTVNISDESSSDGRMRAADALMKLGKYDLAENDYIKVTNLTPQKYQGWIGLIESHTHIYTKRIKSARELNMLMEYINAVKAFAPAELVNSLTTSCISYINAEALKNTNEIERLKSVIWGQQGKITELNGQYSSFISSAAQFQEQAEILNRKLKNLQSSSSYLYVCCCIGVLLTIFSIIPLINGVVGFFIFLLITGLLLVSLPIINAIRKALIASKIQESNNLAAENYTKSNNILIEKNAIQNAMVSNQRILSEYN